MAAQSSLSGLPMEGAADTARDLLARRVGRSRVPLALPLAWLLAVLVCIVAGWAVSFDWPPRVWLESTDKVPLTAAKAGCSQPAKKGEKRTAKERREARKERRKCHQREIKLALAKYQHEIQIPVWFLVVAATVFTALLILIGRLVEAFRRQRQRELFAGMMD